MPLWALVFQTVLNGFAQEKFSVLIAHKRKQISELMRLGYSDKTF